MWDNRNVPHGQLLHPEREWRIASTRNLACAARWFVAAHATTPYVLIMDDDLMPSDPGVVADTLAACRAYDGRPVGAVGVILEPGKPYHECRHVGYGKSRRYAQPIDADTPVDVVKGRYFAVATERLAELPMKLPEQDDDIAVSACLNGGVVLAALQQRFTALPTGNEAISARPGHMQQRELARRRWFGRRPDFAELAS
jgi:hypothetical protein